MTVLAAKEKLHHYIDDADEKKVFELLLLLENDEDNSHTIYDEDTLKILRERSEEYLSGRSITYTPEESLIRIRAHRKQNGI